MPSYDVFNPDWVWMRGTAGKYFNILSGTSPTFMGGPSLTDFPFRFMFSFSRTFPAFSSSSVQSPLTTTSWFYIIFPADPSDWGLLENAPTVGWHSNWYLKYWPTSQEPADIWDIFGQLSTIQFSTGSLKASKYSNSGSGGMTISSIRKTQRNGAKNVINQQPEVNQMWP